MNPDKYKEADSKMNENKTGKRVKKRTVLLAVLGLFLLVVGVTIAANWDTVKVMKVAMTEDPETILAQQEEKNKEMEKELGIDGMVTDEMVEEAQGEMEELLSVSVEDAVTIIETRNEEAKAEAARKSSEEIVAKYTAQLYGLQGAFQGRASGLISSAKAEYMALPPEQHTAANKRAIISSKIAQGEAMEGQCDAMVESILGQMASELSANGLSTAPVGQLRSQYQSIKASQKAAYLSMARSY